MKICIVGKDSYIGNHIDEWLSARGHQVYQLDVMNEEWESFDFSPFDAVIQVAGIVHRPNCTDAELYRRVNTDMPVKIAQLFKKEAHGHKTFVFLSTMAVYGMAKRLSKNVVRADTPANPSGLYGLSKKAAEDGLLKLQDDTFDIVIIRPPNVYGKDCKGGYIPGFLNVVKKLPIIPQAYTDIRQSMLYIDNLSELVRLLLENNRAGIFMPQDDRPVSAVDILQTMATGIGKGIKTSRILGLCVRLLSFLPIVKKAYGGIEYDESLSKIPGLDYVAVSFSKAMIDTIK